MGLILAESSSILVAEMMKPTNIVSSTLKSHFSALVYNPASFNLARILSRLVGKSYQVRYLGYYWRKVKIIELCCNN